MKNRQYFIRIGIPLIIINLILVFLAYDIFNFRTATENTTGFSFDVVFMERLFWIVFFVGDVVVLLTHTLVEKYKNNTFKESEILDGEIDY